MTARQPPGEKGAKACTIGCDSSRDEYFCAYFSGELTKKESKSMENGAKYVVTTHWGTFSLDEASYQDYLAGNLWICWTPGKPQQQKQNVSGYIPPNVTDRAVAFCDQADKTGVLSVLHQLGVHDALIPYISRLSDLSIDEMNLTVRSSNGLKRANAGTFGRLRDLLAMENGILSVRNLGQKSAKEIKQHFFEECYSRLLPYEKAQYWQEVIDNCLEKQ